MEAKETRESSVVFFGPRQVQDPVEFGTRKFELVPNFAATPYQSKENERHRKIFEVLKGLYTEHCNSIKRFKLDEEESKTEKPVRLSRAQKINQKRALVAGILKTRPHVNFREVCSISGCSFKLVKRVFRDMQWDGTFKPYNYPNLKPPEVLAQFDESVRHLQGSFKTIADLKRENPHCSRKWIARQIKQTGFRWLKLKRKLKNPPEKRPKAKAIIRVISHLMQALSCPRAVVLYIDEAHFPLFQTSDKRWTLGMHLDDRIYNHRVFPTEKLTVVAACDLTGFVAIQIFKRDVNSDDFLHLLQSLLDRYTANDQVTVLADQATYHTSARVMLSAASRFLHLNVPGLFRLNAIENCFSFVRAEFRKRPLVRTFEEEAALLVQIFYHPDNARRFEGIHKNHLRQLLLLLMENSLALEDINDPILQKL